MSPTSSILAVAPSLLEELWRRRPLAEVLQRAPGGRLTALGEALKEAGAREAEPLARAVTQVPAPLARAAFEALCEAAAEGVWDVPGWVLKPYIDVAKVLAHGRTPYPPGLEPDGFSTPELYVWLDARRDRDSLDAVRQRLAQAMGESFGPDPALARDVCETLADLLERARAEELLLVIEHPQGI